MTKEQIVVRAERARIREALLVELKGLDLLPLQWDRSGLAALTPSFKMSQVLAVIDRVIPEEES